MFERDSSVPEERKQPGSDLTCDAVLFQKVLEGDADLVVMEMSLSGVLPSRIKVTIDDDQVFVDAVRGQAVEKEKNDYVYKDEIYHGNILRQVELLPGLQGNLAATSFHNGILRVEIPRVAPPKTRPPQENRKTDETLEVITGSCLGVLDRDVSDDAVVEWICAGVDPGTFTASIEGNTLSMKGKIPPFQNPTVAKDDGTTLVSGITRGPIEQTVTLPCLTYPEKAKYSFISGSLIAVLPRRLPPLPSLSVFLSQEVQREAFFGFLGISSPQNAQNCARFLAAFLEFTKEERLEFAKELARKMMDLYVKPDGEKMIKCPEPHRNTCIFDYTRVERERGEAIPHGVFKPVLPHAIEAVRGGGTLLDGHGLEGSPYLAFASSKLYRTLHRRKPL